MIRFCTEHYTLEVAGSQCQPYYIGPKRGKGQVCLTRQCLHPFPSRWRGVKNEVLVLRKVGRLDKVPEISKNIFENALVHFYI